MEDLLKYFIERTDSRFEHLSTKMDRMEEKLNDLERFKASMMASARTTSLIVSGVSGAVTFLGTAIIIPWIKDHLLK